MQGNQFYFDYASTTPVDPRVAKRMIEFMSVDGHFGNPGSRSHSFGCLLYTSPSPRDP